MQQASAITLEHDSATLEGGSAAPTQSAAADSIVQFEDKTYNPYLSKKKMKLKWKVNSRPISSATTKSSPKH